jgi:hypothetical protein
VVTAADVPAVPDVPVLDVDPDPDDVLLVVPMFGQWCVAVVPPLEEPLELDDPDEPDEPDEPDDPEPDEDDVVLDDDVVLAVVAA